MLEQLVERGGYLALFLGMLIEGEAVLLAAGALAHRGLFSFSWVVVTALAGGLCSDLLWYSIGRRYGTGFIQKRARLARHSAAVQHWMNRAGLLFVIGFHFMYGLRTIAPLIFGASRFSAQRFILLDLVGLIAWALSVAGVGYGLGASLHKLLGRAIKPEGALVLGLSVAAIIGVMTQRRIVARRRAANGTPPNA